MSPLGIAAIFNGGGIALWERTMTEGSFDRSQPGTRSYRATGGDFARPVPIARRALSGKSERKSSPARAGRTNRRQWRIKAIAIANAIVARYRYRLRRHRPFPIHRQSRTGYELARGCGSPNAILECASVPISRLGATSDFRDAQVRFNCPRTMGRKKLVRDVHLR